MNNTNLWNKFFSYIYIFLLVLPNIIWIFYDKSVWPWDQAWYGEVSVNLYYLLSKSRFFDWLLAMVNAFGIKAPAIAWFGQLFVPLSHIVGSIDRALLMQIVLAQLFSLIFIYKVILLLAKTKKLALLGCLIMASAPLFIGIGHQYLVESLQLFIVTFVVYIFFNIGIWNKYNSLIAFIFSIAYAMLVKISSPLYFMPVILTSLIYLIHRNERTTLREYFRNKTRVFLYVLGLLFLAFVVSWYIINWSDIYRFLKLTSSGSVALLYGSKSSFFNKFSVWFLLFGKSFFVSVVAYITYFTVVSVFFIYIFEMKKKITLRNLAGAFFISVLSILLTLVIFSFQVNEEHRYLLPLLPYLVIIICLTVDKINHNWFLAFFVFTFFCQYIFVNSIALGLIKNSPQQISKWVIPADSETNNLEILEAIIRQTCVNESEHRINMVGVEHQWLNANSASYYAAQNRLKTNRLCYYTSLGFAEKDAEAAWKRVKSYNPPFFIFSDHVITKELEPFNQVSSQVLERIVMDKNFVQQNFPRSNVIKIYKNRNL